MKVQSTPISDVLVIEPRLFEDERGFFFESFNQRSFSSVTGLDVTFVQDNHSRSKKGVLRGLHYQVNRPQGKLVRVARGAVFDVAVDLRRSSDTFKKWIAVELTEYNHKQLWIPAGFAHGSLVLSESADLLYKVTDFHAPEYERCIAWNDPDIRIGWPVERLGQGEMLLSERDRMGELVSSAEVFP